MQSLLKLSSHTLLLNTSIKLQSATPAGYLCCNAVRGYADDIKVVSSSKHADPVLATGPLKSLLYNAENWQRWYQLDFRWCASNRRSNHQGTADAFEDLDQLICGAALGT